ncbi:MAG: hypothetical protein RL318_2375 [Fibrobacterota bacterium]
MFDGLALELLQDLGREAEGRSATARKEHFLASMRIAGRSRFAIGSTEAPEAAQLDRIAGFEMLPHQAKESLQDFLSLRLGTALRLGSVYRQLEFRRVGHPKQDNTKKCSIAIHILW